MLSIEVNIVRAFVAAINRQDVAEMGRLMSDDHQFIDSSGRSVSGRDTMIAGWLQYFRMFPDYEIKVESIVADSERVAVFGSAHGTYNGKRGLVAANRIEMPAALKAVVTNGQVKIWQVYTDWSEGLKVIAEDQKTG